MDTDRKLISSSLQNLATDIDYGKYGQDTDFEEEAFLDDLEKKVVEPLGREII